MQRPPLLPCYSLLVLTYTLVLESQQELVFVIACAPHFFHPPTPYSQPLPSLCCLLETHDCLLPIQ